MSTISVAVIENDTVINVADFDSATFFREMWEEFYPHRKLVPLHELPEGCWIGWTKNEEGVFSNEL